MDFIDNVKQYSAKVEKLKEHVLTEEATKTSLIMPFFQQVLGYDVFNPQEFIPEFTASFGVKKDARIDYAILKDGQPIILIEAKSITENIDKTYDSQLAMYLNATKAKFGILTNGIVYKFYTDLEETNKMDNTPFLEVDLLNLKDNYVHEIRKFHKENFDIENIFSTASELKYSKAIKEYMATQLENPSDEFVKTILSSGIYEGVKTQNVMEKFKIIVKKSLNEFLSEFMNEKITAALKPNIYNDDNGKESEGNEQEQSDEVSNIDSRIVTTVEEIESFYIVKSILAETIKPERITYKDTASYFGILLDNNTWKWICRIRLRENSKTLIIPDENKKEKKYELSDINDIFKYKKEIIEALQRH